jgi:hypothetical protein
MSQDSIGVVTTGRGKLQEWKTTQKQNLSRKSRGTLTVKWAGSRDKIFSPSGRGITFFLTSLFIELIEKDIDIDDPEVESDNGKQKSPRRPAVLREPEWVSHCPSITKDLAQARDAEGSLVIRATEPSCSTQISTSEFV